MDGSACWTPAMLSGTRGLRRPKGSPVLDRWLSDSPKDGRRSSKDALEAVRDLRRRLLRGGPEGYVLKKMLRGVMLSELSGTVSSVAGASWKVASRPGELS